MRWSGDGHMKDEAIKAVVGDEEVAAATEYEEGQGALASETDGFEEFGLGFDFTEEARWAADTEGSVWGERNLLIDADGHGIESTTPGCR